MISAFHEAFTLFSVNYFYWPFQGGASFVDYLCYFCLVLFCFHARLLVDALWSPAEKGLASWLSFVMSNCGVTFSLVSWVRCGAWLYRFLIFALFLTLTVLFSVNLVGQFLQVHSRKITQTGIKKEQTFLHETHHFDPIYNPTRYH